LAAGVAAAVALGAAGEPSAARPPVVAVAVVAVVAEQSRLRRCRNREAREQREEQRLCQPRQHPRRDRLRA